MLRGWAASGAAGLYEAERRPVAEYTAARSADPRGSIRPAEQEVRADLGGRIAHVWTGERSTLDLLGPGLTLFAARDEPAWESAAAALTARVPVAVRLLDPVAARAVGAAGRSALLAQIRRHARRRAAGRRRPGAVAAGRGRRRRRLRDGSHPASHQDPFAASA